MCDFLHAHVQKVAVHEVFMNYRHETMEFQISSTSAIVPQAQTNIDFFSIYE